MPRVREIRKCERCGHGFHRHNGNVNAIYCSRLCACRDRNVGDHQKNAGMVGGSVIGNIKRGTGKKGYIKLRGRHIHRVVIEKKIGRKLKSVEIVHHKDGNKHNNRLKNLEMMTQSEHAKLHARQKWNKTI